MTGLGASVNAGKRPVHLAVRLPLVDSPFPVNLQAKGLIEGSRFERLERFALTVCLQDASVEVCCSMVFVGIDWADQEHEVCLMDQEGTELARFRVRHSRQGLELLRERILQHAGTPEQAPCFQETSQGLLVQFLSGSGLPP